jgi:hypothetical protein
MSGWFRGRLGTAGRIGSAAVLAGVLAAGSSAAAGQELGSGPAVAGAISTVAGGPGGPGPATKVSVRPCDVAAAPGGLYVGDTGANSEGDLVRQVSDATGQLTTVAGTGAGGPLGLGGPATSADWQNGGGGCGVAAGPGGDLVISIFQTNQVLLVPGHTDRQYGQAMTKGHIYAIAGNGTQGFSGDGGLGTAAELSAPFGVAVDGAGNVLIADDGNNRVRVVAAQGGTFYGVTMRTGHIYTVAGDGGVGRGGDGGPARKAQLNSPAAVAVTSTGNLVISNQGYHHLRVVPATSGTFYGVAMTAGDIYTVGGTSEYISSFSATAVDAAGNIVYADIFYQEIRVVANTTGTFYGQAMTAGDTYTVAGDGVPGYSGDGGPATSAEFSNPVGVAVDAAGNLVIADENNLRVRVVAASTGTFYGVAMTAGDIYTVAGNGNYRLSGAAGPATAAQLGQPASVGVDAAGDVLIPDTVNNRVMVTAAATGTLYGRAVTAGHIYDEAGDGVPGYSGDGHPGYLAEVSSPEAATADGAGNLVIADTGNERIRVAAARTGTFYGQHMTAGDIYTVAGDGTQGYSGDGGPATSAAIAYPYGIAVDGAGNLVIPDTGNNRIRVVAARTGTFYGQAMTAGDIYTVTGTGACGFSGDGGAATSAELCQPYGVAVDSAGNLVIDDSDNERIRVVAARAGTFYGQHMTAGDIYTVAGNGTGGYAGDGGPATSAELNFPQGVAIDGAGNLLIADTFNSRVRVVAATAGTFYGVAMTAGNIYTVAGTGACGFSGDGGAAPSAELCEPGGVAADGANLLIADSGYGNSANDRIREVTG